MEEASKPIQTKHQTIAAERLCIGHLHPVTHSLLKYFHGEPFIASCKLTRPLNCKIPFNVRHPDKAKGRRLRAYSQEPLDLLFLSFSFALLESPVCTSDWIQRWAWKLTPHEFWKFGEGKNFTNQRCFFLSFLVPGVFLVAVMGFTSPALRCQYQEMGKVTLILRDNEGGGIWLESRASTGGQQEFVLQSKNCCESSVGPVKRYFKGRLAVWVRAVERVGSVMRNFSWWEGSREKYQDTEAQAKCVCSPLIF